MSDELKELFEILRSNDDVNSHARVPSNNISLIGLDRLRVINLMETVENKQKDDSDEQ